MFIHYLGYFLCLWPPEEGGLGGEEGEVIALLIQAAVPTAHAIAASHLRGWIQFGGLPTRVFGGPNAPFQAPGVGRGGWAGSGGPQVQVKGQISTRHRKRVPKLAH